MACWAIAWRSLGGAARNWRKYDCAIGDELNFPAAAGFWALSAAITCE
jgi:hypothetical protein